MPQAIVSPEEVRRFAAELKNFNSSLDSDCKKINSRLKALGNTWRDQEHKKFEQEFTQTERIIKQFLQKSQEYVPFLIRKATKAEEYLRQR